MTTTPFRLDGKRALVTGGASGIGEQCCRVLTAAGAAVTVCDLDEARAQALAAELKCATALACDISHEAAVNASIATIPELDILINCAGIGLVGGLEETALADFQRLFRVNVEGTFLVTRALMKQLIASHGSIVNIGSVAGLIGVKRRYAYCATKGAIVANCICPGTVESPFVEGYLDKYHSHEKEEMRAQLHARQPIGRMGRPLEIANMALYLSSAEAEFVNGSVITIDGGWTAA